MDTMADKEFLAKFEKAKFEITPVSGEKVAALVEEIYRTTSAADAEKAAGMVQEAIRRLLLSRRSLLLSSPRRRGPITTDVSN